MAESVYFISMPYGINYYDWKDSVHFTLEYTDFDYAFYVEQPPATTYTETQDVIENCQWLERSNRLILIKSRMSKSIIGSIGDCDTIMKFN